MGYNQPIIKWIILLVSLIISIGGFYSSLKIPFGALKSEYRKLMIWGICGFGLSAISFSLFFFSKKPTQPDTNELTLQIAQLNDIQLSLN